MSITWESTASTSTNVEKNRLAKQDQIRGNIRTVDKVSIYGRIIEQKTILNRYGFKTLQVRLHLEERDSTITRGVEKCWYGLAYPIEHIVHVFGNDLINKRCILQYKSIQPNNGIVYISHEEEFVGDLEAAETLPSVSTLLAPPGSGI